MLEFKVGPEEMRVHIEAKNLAQVCTETVLAISTIYKRLGGANGELYKLLITENISIAFASDAEIDARTKYKGKQLLDALNAAIEALEKAMDTDAD